MKVLRAAISREALSGLGTSSFKTTINRPGIGWPGLLTGKKIPCQKGKIRNKMVSIVFSMFFFRQNRLKIRYFLYFLGFFRLHFLFLTNTICCGGITCIQGFVYYI